MMIQLIMDGSIGFKLCMHQSMLMHALRRFTEDVYLQNSHFRIQVRQG